MERNLYFIGNDSWGRPVYQIEASNQFVKDINDGLGQEPDLYTYTPESKKYYIEGEPAAKYEVEEGVEIVVHTQEDMEKEFDYARFRVAHAIKATVSYQPLTVKQIDFLSGIHDIERTKEVLKDLKRNPYPLEYDRLDGWRKEGSKSAYLVELPIDEEIESVNAKMVYVKAMDKQSIDAYYEEKYGIHCLSCERIRTRSLDNAVKKGMPFVNVPTENEKVQIAAIDELRNYNLAGDVTFRYQMLGRLISDCDYYLSCPKPTSAVLWGNEEEKQIHLIQTLYDSFTEEEKPEWITQEQIDEYTERMEQFKYKNNRTIDGR